MPPSLTLRPEHVLLLRQFLIHEQRSRADLVQATGWTRRTVALRLSELLGLGWLVPAEAPAPTGQPGRPTTLFRLLDERVLVLVTLFDWKVFTSALVTLRGRVLQESTVRFDLADGPTAAARLAADQTDSMVRAARLQRTDIVTAVVGLPSPVEDRAKVLNPRLSQWQHSVVGDEFRNTLGIAVLTENDANLMALGEFADHQDCTCLFLRVGGGGIGLGTVIRGQLHRGLRNLAGELGRVPTRTGYGSSPSQLLRDVASTPAILAHARSLGIEVGTVAQLGRFVEQGHPAATAALERAGTQLGKVMIPITEALAPHHIAIGGVAVLFNEHLLGAFRSELLPALHPVLSESLSIRSSPSHLYAAARGATALATEHLLLGRAQV
ncbi:ROK family protein [Streptomyces sp. NPDC090499]|uniref:ROK family protein n=1 Tax=Streptomyces sp. NPDC090499 TaxID=3365965 RepID=UPI00382B29CE